MNSYFQTRKESQCCGCSACANACPKQCISLKPNIEGFLYPVKNSDQCVNCGICEIVCPFTERYAFTTSETPLVYAAYDAINRQGSSSGGIFYSIAKYVIEEKKGWVYGAVLDEKFQVSHIGVNTLEGLQQLRGSKYVQSCMSDTYSHIKTQLAEGVYVFFTGTPCQVAGLRAFLKNRNYDNLLAADVVCHGTPPQSLFDEHIRYLEKKHNATLVSYHFRNLNGWGGCEIADFINPKKHRVLPSYNLSPYLYSFMHSMTYRESCYECKFATIPRQGDVTLADFWGVKEFFPGIDSAKGVSLVMLNTDKGASLWTNISDKFVAHKSSLADGVKYNRNIIQKSPRPELRNKIFEEIKIKGYEKVADEYFTIDNYHIMKIKNTVAEIPIIKRILEWKK